MHLSSLLLVCFDFSSFCFRSSFFLFLIIYLFLSFSLPFFPVVLFLVYYIEESTPIKGSVERSSLPWAIFLSFTRNRPWKSEDHLCTLFFIEMSKKSFEKAKEHHRFRGVLGRWRTAAIDRTTFMPVSGVKKPPFSPFFLGFGVSFGEEKPFVTSNVIF